METTETDIILKRVLNHSEYTDYQIGKLSERKLEWIKKCSDEDFESFVSSMKTVRTINKAIKRAKNECQCSLGTN